MGKNDRVEPGWHEAVVKGVPPLIYVGFGIFVGATIIALSSAVPVDEKHANLFGGILGGVFGSTLAVWGSIYLVRREERSKERLAGLDIETLLDDVDRFIRHDVLWAKQRGAVNMPGASSRPEKDEEYRERVLGTAQTCKRYISELAASARPTTSFSFYVRRLIKALNMIEAMLIILDADRVLANAEAAIGELPPKANRVHQLIRSSARDGFKAVQDVRRASHLDVPLRSLDDHDHLEMIYGDGQDRVWTVSFDINR